LPGSKHENIISETEFWAWAFSAEIIGARVARGKYELVSFFRKLAKEAAYGTKLVWNSFKSTLREPSKRKEAVIDETT
jgi:hypothetical protein